MMMWSCRDMVLAAICVNCAARASQSLAVSLRTIGSAYWMMSGADSIDSIIAARTGCASSLGTSRLSVASASITSASSPACAR